MNKKSGLADSPFFTSPENRTEVTPPSPKLPDQKENTKKAKKTKEKEKIVSSSRDTTIPRNHDTMVSRHQDTTTPQVHGVSIELIRKAVKEFGKEAATHRFTIAEKKEIAEILFTYKNRGIKTSENEIARISVNFIIEDYKENGENSVLHKILEALNE